MDFLQEVFELIKSTRDENELFEKFLKIEKKCEDKAVLELAQQQIRFAIIGLKERRSLEKQIRYFQTLKNIAKIIETQYELKYILPIIGEMVDNLISEHLIYIFLKNAHKKEYKLAWPAKCSSEEIVENLLKIKSSPLVTKNMGIFPLLCNEKTIGALVAYSPSENLSNNEVSMLNELSKQASTTVSKAMENAKTLKDATLDALTGLNNRRQFETRLKQEVATATRQNTDLCAIMLDVDHFKKVNDTYGHAVGDTVLKAVARIIKKEIREYDIPARYGGEEFVVILPHTNIKEATLVAERLREKIEKRTIDISEFGEEFGEISVTISLGVSLFERDAKNPAAAAANLYESADKALYRAKEGGRNKVVIFG